MNLIKKITNQKKFHLSSKQTKKFSTHQGKTAYWFFRDINYNFNHLSRYKNFEIHRDKENKRIELIPFKEDYKSILIWLYAGDLIDHCIYQILEYNNFPVNGMKIVILSAPYNPITFHSAILEHNWFNILELPDSEGNRFVEKKEINYFTKNIIFNEINHQYTIIGDNKKIFIGGFSQSACMAIHAGLTYTENLGGIISFAGFKFDFTQIDEDKKYLPILSCNGEKDDVVIIKHVKASFQSLINLNFNLKFVIERGLYHSFSETSLNYAKDFLNNQILKINI
jgi:predicted esterase